MRRDFIDPLFNTLGWDMDNSAGYAEAYRDVIHEDAIKVGISTRAPDYSFRIGGACKFFLEAKKPSVNVKEATVTTTSIRRLPWPISTGWAFPVSHDLNYSKRTRTPGGVGGGSIR